MVGGGLQVIGLKKKERRREARGNIFPSVWFVHVPR